MDRICAVPYKPNVKPPDYYEDVIPSHRLIGDPYSLRIGDCVFIVPPERISVESRSNASSTNVIREKSGIKTKTGYRTTEIRLKLWFNNVDEINGVVLAAPDGSEYYMDGLRSIMAQFRRSPFLPVENYYLNHTHNIWAVTMSSMVVSTVPEFPGCLQVELAMFKFDPYPHTGINDVLYDKMFCWPLFRWYYQQQLNGGRASQLAPIATQDMTGKFQFSLVKEENLIEETLNKLLEDREIIQLSNNTVITGMSMTYQNRVNHVQTQLAEQPTHQFLGSNDVGIMMEMFTTSEEDVASIRYMLERSEYLARHYRDRLVSGYIRLENELAQMFGTEFVMIMSSSIDTIEGLPGSYSIRLMFTDFNPLQRSQESLRGFSPVNEGTAKDLITVSPRNTNFIIHDVRTERLLGAIELYPDLELPGYGDVNKFIPVLNNWRIGRKLNTIGIRQLEQPPKSTYVDPDFYMFYPPIELLAPVDPGEPVFQEQAEAARQIERAIMSPVGGNYAHLNLNSYSGLKADEINRYINRMRRRTTKMTGTGAAFLQAEATTGINALFLIALAANESGWGDHGFGNNIFGWGAFNANPSNALRFSKTTMTETITFIAGQIKRQYLDRGRTTAYLFQHHPTLRPYAQLDNGQPNPAWLRTITNIMTNMARHFGLDGKFVSSQVNSSATEVAASPTNPGNIDTSKAGTIEYADIGVERIQYTGDKLYERMCHNMSHFSKRGTMLRAFPSYVFLIVDEGEWIDGRRLWSNYYAYHAVSDISIHKSRTNPVDTAYIRMSNIYGNLTTRSQIVKSDAKHWWDRWQEILIPTINEKMIEEKNKLRSNLNIHAGARVHIRIGYGGAPFTFPIVFNGTIVELSAEDEFTAICQSDGIQISNPVASWGEKAKNTVFNLGNEPANILHTIFVRRQGIATSYFGESSEFGIEHFGHPIRAADGILGFFRALTDDNIEKYDLTKNMYRANSVSGNDPIGWRARAAWLSADGEVNIQMWLYGKSVWDVSQVLAKAVPGYIAYPHDHGFHSTYFYGRPHWLVRYRYIQVGDNQLDPSSYKEAIKPFQQHHVMRSDMDIIHNGIVASGEGLITNVKAAFTQDVYTASSPVVYADRTIRPEQQRTAVIDSTTVQNLIIPFGTIENLVSMLIGRPGRRIATNVAVSVVADSFKNMYRGELLTIGDPSVKPHDVISLIDPYTKMFGLFEVKEIVHQMSFETGFVTSIVPDLIVVQRDDRVKHEIVTSLLWHGVTAYTLNMAKHALYDVAAASAAASKAKLNKIGGKVAGKVSAANTKIMMSSEAYKKFILRTTNALQANQYIAKTGAAAGKIKAFFAANTAASTAAAAGTTAAAGVSWLAVIIAIGTWAIIDSIVTLVTDQFKHNNVIKIYPLTLKDRPFVAGISGSKHLLPGMQNDSPAEAELEEYVPPSGKTQVASWTGTMQMPIGIAPGQLRSMISSDFNAPRPRGRHQGIDLLVPVGTPVYAVAPGRVSQLYLNPAYQAGSAGLGVEIDHGSGHRSRYLHLSEILVSNNQQVAAGHMIGRSGNTGESYGPHLHFDFKINGTPVDPKPFLLQEVRFISEENRE